MEDNDFFTPYEQGFNDHRIIIFSRLRELIYEKDRANDEIATAILGWAYERLADDI